MISFKEDDDDDEEDEDPFMKPLTKEFEAKTNNEEYYFLPIKGRKPTMGIRFGWEDHRRRCYLTNIMEKLKMKLVCGDYMTLKNNGKPTKGIRASYYIIMFHKFS